VVVSHLGRVGQVEPGRLDGFKGQIDAGDLVLRATQRTEDDHVVVRLWEDDPFTASRPDERANGKTHALLPKMCGCRVTISSHVSR
jgi:hypothetical protein